MHATTPDNNKKRENEGWRRLVTRDSNKDPEERDSQDDDIGQQAGENEANEGAL